jgi:hypothetical protein
MIAFCYVSQPKVFHSFVGSRYSPCLQCYQGPFEYKIGVFTAFSVSFSLNVMN